MIFSLLLVTTTSLTNEEFLIKTNPYAIDMLIFESSIHLKYFITFHYHIHINAISKELGN